MRGASDSVDTGSWPVIVVGCLIDIGYLLFTEETGVSGFIAAR